MARAAAYQRAAKQSLPEATAKALIAALKANRSDTELKKIQRYFRTEAGFIGVRMGTVFQLARAAHAMSLKEIETLLESDIHEARAAAVRIMAEQASHRKATAEQQEALARLYLRRHDRIDNWDLVDLGAWHVLGRWVKTLPKRDVLYRLARSKNQWERRSGVLATLAFLKSGGTEDAFALSELLVSDKEDLVHKAVGGVLRSAGQIDRKGMTAFLERHAATMPRVMLRYALEKFPAREKARWMAMGKA